MSIAAVSSSSSNSNGNGYTTSSKRAQFQQLGQDLMSGNITAAQQDFGALMQSTLDSTSGSTGTSSSASNSTATSGLSSISSISKTVAGSALKQEMTVLQSSLQAGNLSAARKAYSAVQEDAASIQKIAQRQHRTIGSSSSTSSDSTDPINQLLSSASGTTSSSSTVGNLLNMLASSASSAIPGASLATSLFSAIA